VNNVVSPLSSLFQHFSESICFQIKYLKRWDFQSDLTFFSAPFNNCLKCLVTLGMVTDKRKFFKIFLIHINPDVIINDTTTNSLHQSFQDENNVLSFNYTNSLFLVIGTLSF